MKKVFLFAFLNIIFFVFCFNVSAANDIPKMYFYGDLSNMTSKSDVRELEYKYVSTKSSFSGYATAKIQGASSTTFAKKNFNIQFYTNNKYSTKKNVDFGFGNFSKYTFKADWPDGTKSRNVVTADIYSQIQKKYGLFTNTINYGVIDGFTIELYLNDEFYGIYNLTTSKDYIYGLDENNKNHMAIMAKGYDAKTNFSELATEKWKSFEVEVGEENDYSLAKLNRLIRFVKNSSDKEFKDNFENYINLDSALNYYCYAKFGELYDNLNKNLMLITYDGDYWYLTMYDLDISWGSTWNGLYLLDYTDMLDTYVDSSMLWSKFEKAFPDEIARRYEELRSSILTEENVLNTFYSYYNLIPDSSFEKENEKWDPLVGYGMDQIEEFLDIRIKLVDADIEKLKTDEYDKINDNKEDNVVDDNVSDDNITNESDIKVDNNKIDNDKENTSDSIVTDDKKDEDTDICDEDIEEVITDNEDNLSDKYSSNVDVEKDTANKFKKNNFIEVLIISLIVVTIVFIFLIVIKIKNR